MEKISSNHPQHKGADQSIHQGSTTGHQPHQHSPRYSRAQHTDHLLKIAEKINKSKGELGLFIYGNLASGKTTVMKQIAEHIPDNQYFTLDEYRERAFRDNPGIPSWEKEKTAQRNLFNDLEQAINEGKTLIIESTYLTKPWKKALHKFKLKLYMLKVSADRNECFRRYMQRQEDKGHSPVLQLLATKKPKTSFHKSYDAIAWKHYTEAHIYTPDEIIFT